MKIEEIKDPTFLKNMKKDELIQLADEIRSFLVENIAKTGGHLASNLGDVELIMSLHKNFDFTHDKILFDVGHQAYTHKILTGRAKDFQHLRQIDGISGFLRHEESPYDHFESGHSSTSISTAIGMAIARDANHEKNEIIAFIGDGSIANGIAFEALNNIASNHSKVIIVLNDNDMAINQSVGAIAKALGRVKTSRTYTVAKNGFVKLFNWIPFFGPKIVNATRSFVHFIHRIFRSDNMFDNFDISYLGPVDGHDFKQLDKAFKKAKKYPKSILIHVKTKKGYGYKISEDDEIGKYHSVPPFDVQTGKPLKKIPSDSITFSNAVSKAVYTIMQENPDTFLISAAMVLGSKLSHCFDDFSNRCLDVGIAEEHAICVANGLQLSGKLPIVSMYSTFLQRGYDEIVHDICRINANVLFLIDRAGIVGEDGQTHQGMFDTSFLYPLEHSIIAMPSCQAYIYPLMKELLAIKGSKFIRYQKENILQQNNIEKVELFKMVPMNMKNENVATLICVGTSFWKIKKLVDEQQLPFNLIDPLFLKPLDYTLLDSIAAKPVFIYDNTSVYDGFASSIYQYLTKKECRTFCFTLPNQYIKHGDVESVLRRLKLDEESVLKQIVEVLNDAA